VFDDRRLHRLRNGEVDLLGGHGGHGDVAADERVELGASAGPFALHRGGVVLRLIQGQVGLEDVEARDVAHLVAGAGRLARARRDLLQLARGIQPPLRSGQAEEGEIDLGRDFGLGLGQLGFAGAKRRLRHRDTAAALAAELDELGDAQGVVGKLVGALVTRLRVRPLASDVDAGLVHGPPQAGGGDGGVGAGEGQRLVERDRRNGRRRRRSRRGRRLSGGQPGPEK